MKWHTQNARSVLAHVRQPGNHQLAFGLFEHAEGKHLRECLIGRPPEPGKASKANDWNGREEVHAGPRTVEGNYTDLAISWRGIRFRCRTAVLGDDLVAKIEPESATLPLVPPLLTLEAALLWNQEGTLERSTDCLVLSSGGVRTEVFCTAPFSGQRVAALGSAHATVVLDGPIGISTGERRSLASIDAALEEARAARDARFATFGPGPVPELAGAVSSALGWTQVFDPARKESVTTVSRVWAARNNGAVLFCWDSLFAAMMAYAVGDYPLALSNLDTITRPIEELGYIPNVMNAAGSASFGHSQPPVGGFALRYLRNTIDDKALPESLLDRLVTWNRWWPRHRVHHGFLCWGSRREPPRVGGSYEEGVTGGKQGACFESGLDNSPIFDDATFDQESGLLLQADVGLHSLYIRDCLDLAALCEGRDWGETATELRERAGTFLRRLDSLWDETTGIYRDMDLCTGTFSRHLSPCNFYPLLTGRVPVDRAERMIREHFHNPAEFAGEFMLPSIARNDPAYGDQSYWRGRIWAPMNFLVYAGLAAAGQTEAARILATKGNALFLHNWREAGIIGENYHADTGSAGDRANSDPFNSWGALLGLVGLLDAGAVPPLPQP